MKLSPHLKRNSRGKEERGGFFLEHIDREPTFVENEEEYKKYLFSTTVPVLYTDDRERLLEQIVDLTGKRKKRKDQTTEQLKDELEVLTKKKKEIMIAQQINALKSYQEYDNVMATFADIQANRLYDTPLMLEWNTWRAMTMLDGGDIKANLRLDDKGMPMSTAQGNVADIVCDYGDFGLTVEVTMQSGQRQYEMEGEPVSRHLAKLKRESGKEAYCLFLAPKINESCIAYFYALHQVNIAFYGGKSVIVPLELEVFIHMLEQSYQADYIPNTAQIKGIFQYSLEQAEQARDEKEWYSKVTEKALHWL